MNSARRAGSIAMAFTFLTFAAPVLAQDAAARVLAQEGKALVDAGDFDGGCPKLEEASRMDPQLLGAGFTLGECYERQGKLASAWSTYDGVAGRAAARGESRATQAKAKADALKPRLSTVRVHVSPEIMSVVGLRVTFDGREVTSSQLNTAVPRDGGKVELVVAATGRLPWATWVEIPKEGAAIEVTAALGAAQQDSTKRVVPQETVSQPAREDTFWKPLHIGGMVGTALGAAALGAGGILGVLAIDRRDESNQPGGCDPDTNRCQTADAVALRSQSLALGDASTALFVVGGLSAAAGIIMLAVPLDDEAPMETARWWIGPTGARLEVSFQ